MKKLHHEYAMLSGSCTWVFLTLYLYSYKLSRLKRLMNPKYMMCGYYTY